MSKQDDLTKLARECGATTYTNRHFPLATAFSFSPLTWEKFCAALAAQHEPFTEWLTCPKCSHKSPYSPIKAKTLAEDAERITKQARAALGQRNPMMDGLTAREASIVRFAVHTFASDARQRLSAAAQDKDNRYFKPGAVDAFATDARDAETLLAKLMGKNA